MDGGQKREANLLCKSFSLQIRRAKSQRMKVKALVHHVPTEQDIADLLKEFTVDFLLKARTAADFPRKIRK